MLLYIYICNSKQDSVLINLLYANEDSTVILIAINTANVQISLG